jgi:hypothetical protein
LEIGNLVKFIPKYCLILNIIKVDEKEKLE